MMKSFKKIVALGIVSASCGVNPIYAQVNNPNQPAAANAGVGLYANGASLNVTYGTVANTSLQGNALAAPTPIGNTTPNTGAFTTLSATGTVTGSGFSGLFSAPYAIGNTTPNTGAFTTLSATGAVTGSGFSGLFASPYAIGSTTPNSGIFTTLSGATITATSALNTVNLTANGAVSGTGFANYEANINHIQTVSNVAGLQATACVPGLIYATTGYTVQNDGGNGTYICTSNTTATTNGGTIIAASNSNRYYLMYNDVVRAKQFGAKGDGSTIDDTALNNLFSSGVKNIFIDYGNYVINTGNFVFSDNQNITFADGASFIANTNNITFFKITTHAYYAQINTPTLNGNGKTGVVGFDLNNFRLSASINNATVINMNIGFIVRGGCFGSVFLNPSSFNTPYVVQAIANDATLNIINPSFDNEVGNGGSGVGIGIDVQGAGIPNEGFIVAGGYVQGFGIGLQDAGIGTRINNVYFEANTTADVFANNARGSMYQGHQFFSSVGAAAYKIRNSDSITIFSPTMGSGARTALFDVDSSNSNIVYYFAGSNASYNTPTGSMTYINTIPIQSTGTFTPTISGSVTSGVGIYSTQYAKYTVTGNYASFQESITWSATTGSGSLVITGAPTNLLPSNITGRICTAIPGFAYTGLIYAYFNGTGTNLTVAQVSASGVVSFIPLPASGSILISCQYEL